MPPAVHDSEELIANPAAEAMDNDSVMSSLGSSADLDREESRPEIIQQNVAANKPESPMDDKQQTVHALSTEHKVAESVESVEARASVDLATKETDFESASQEVDEDAVDLDGHQAGDEEAAQSLRVAAPGSRDEEIVALQPATNDQVPSATQIEKSRQQSPSTPKTPLPTEVPPRYGPWPISP